MEPSLIGMKILFVITKSNWGGAQRYVYDLATAAKGAGADAVVALGGAGEKGAEQGTLAERLSEAGIRIVFIQSFARDIDITRELHAYRELEAVIEREKPDVLHVNSSKAGGLGAFIGRRAGVRKVIFTAHGWAFNERRPLFERAILALLHLVTVWCADEVICVSDAVRRQAAWMPGARRRLRVIRSGIAPFALLPRDEARARLRAREGALHPNRLWILINAELHYTKGIDLALRAMSIVAASRPEPQLVVMGDGEERERLERLAGKLRLTGRAFFLGFIPESKTCLAAGDIFLLPSRSEALGYSLLEAGAAGLPIAASAVGGVPEIIEDGATGLLVPPENIDALAQALLALVDDQILRARLGSALRARVLRDFSEDRMIRETFALYRA